MNLKPYKSFLFWTALQSNLPKTFSLLLKLVLNVSQAAEHAVSACGEIVRPGGIGGWFVPVKFPTWECLRRKPSLVPLGSLGEAGTRSGTQSQDCLRWESPDFRRGRMSITKNKFGESEQIVREGLGIHQWWVEGYNLLSIIHEKSKKIEQAQEDIRQALKNHPYAFYLRERLANLLRFSGDLEESESITREGLILNPYWGEGYAQLPQLSSARHNRKKALEFAEQACRVDPWSSSLKNHLLNLENLPN